MTDGRVLFNLSGVVADVLTSTAFRPGKDTIERQTLMGVIAYLHRQVLLCHGERRGERGAALVEYALLLVLVVVFCIIAVTFLGDTAAEKFSKVGQSVAAT